MMATQLTEAEWDEVESFIAYATSCLLSDAKRCNLGPEYSVAIAENLGALYAAFVLALVKVGALDFKDADAIAEGMEKMLRDDYAEAP